MKKEEVMDFRNEIADFISGRLGGILIVEGVSRTIAYADDWLMKQYGNDMIGKNADEVQTLIRFPDGSAGTACQLIL